MSVPLSDRSSSEEGSREETTTTGQAEGPGGSDEVQLSETRTSPGSAAKRKRDEHESKEAEETGLSSTTAKSTDDPPSRRYIGSRPQDFLQRNHILTEQYPQMHPSMHVNPSTRFHSNPMLMRQSPLAQIPVNELLALQSTARFDQQRPQQRPLTVNDLIHLRSVHAASGQLPAVAPPGRAHLERRGSDTTTDTPSILNFNQHALPSFSTSNRPGGESSALNSAESRGFFGQGQQLQSIATAMPVNQAALSAYHHAAMMGGGLSPSLMHPQSSLSNPLLAAVLLEEQQKLYRLLLLQELDPLRNSLLTGGAPPTGHDSGATVPNVVAEPSRDSDASPLWAPGQVGPPDLGGVVTLYRTWDDESLSTFQCLVRKNIELFAADDQDAQTSAQGRNRKLVKGQVGIRCVHCRILHPAVRARGSTYYPSTLAGVYQAAQNMASGHFGNYCEMISTQMRHRLFALKDRKSSAGTGKTYWGESIRLLGVVEHGGILRFEKDITD